MKIYNQTKTEIINNPDLEKGYLKEDRIQVGINPPVEGRKEIGHYVTVTEYENGGKELKWVIDEPRVDAKPEEPVYENIYIYILYTEEELKTIRISEIQVRLNALNQDFIQAFVGEDVPDFEKRKLEFITLHNELRVLQGKKPRAFEVGNGKIL